MYKRLLHFLCAAACGCVAAPEPEEAPAPPPRPPAPVWDSQDQSIRWLDWEDGPFAAARRLQRPVLLYFAAPGCDGMFHRDRPLLASLVEERFVGVRIDPYRRPDLAQQYPTGGWPAVVFLLPDGRPFARAVDVAERNMEALLLRTLGHFADRQGVIEEKVERLKPSRPHALDRDAVAEGVRRGLEAEAEGEGPFFLRAEALLFLLENDGEAWPIVRRRLDALLASALWDAAGGFRAYGLSADGRVPSSRRDAADQAAMLDLLVLAAARDEARYGAAARRQLDHVAGGLFDPARGYFVGRQVRLGTVWWDDPVFYADRNALLAAAALRAAAALDSPQAAQAGTAALDFLVDCCLDAEGGVYHYYVDGRRGGFGLLADQALAALALLQAGEGASASRIMDFMEKNLFDSERGAFLPRPNGPGAPPYVDGLLPAGNPLAARLYLGLGRPAAAAALLRGRTTAIAPGLAHAAFGRAAARHARLGRTSL